MDEIEKAHTDVYNILLQVLDDGRLTDNKGRTVNFRNTIIIMTSNLGSSLIRERFENIKEENADLIFEKTREEVMEILRKTIRPEFLNRIDEVIMFKPLNQDQILQIVELQFDQIRNMLLKNDIELRIKQSALEWIAEKGFDPQFGARPVKRIIQKYLLNNLSKKIINDEIDKEKPVTITAGLNQLEFMN